MKYRAEIDGLRAIAVLPVIFFHAGFELFSGGFVGVDIFFVISGYLITGIIINEISQGDFSIVNFYERRARRILPALFFVMLICLPFAWFWLPPSHLKDFGQSLVAVSLFSSNFLFWTESGYFTSFAELKPLLHTWSLAVEEQYYIIFPIFLALTWRLGPKFIVIFLGIIFCLSLGLAHWASSSNIPNIISASFLSLPTRGWELLIGVFLAFYIKYYGYLTSKSLNQVFSIIGSVLIIYSIVAFDASTPFPSLYTLIPTIGTGLLILSAVPSTFIYKILSFSPIVGVGLLSYSAYLWHQPILAFAHYKTLFEELSDIALILLCLSSLLFAYISWRWVEKPFRNKNKFSQKRIFTYSFLSIVFFITVGLFIHITNGLKDYKIEYEFSEIENYNYAIIDASVNYNMYDRMVDSECNFWVQDSNQLDLKRINKCSNKFGQPLLILGDSHALNIYNIFSKSLNYPFLIGISQGGCRAHDNLGSCGYSDLLSFIKANNSFTPRIIYHQSGSYFLRGSDNQYEPSLYDNNLMFDGFNVNKVISYLENLIDLGLEVKWLGHFAEYRIDPLMSISRIDLIPEKNFKIFNELDSSVKSIVSERNFKNYTQFASFYTIQPRVLYDECLLWRDPDHFSSCGESIIASEANFQLFQE